MLDVPINVKARSEHVIFFQEAEKTVPCCHQNSSDNCWTTSWSIVDEVWNSCHNSPVDDRSMFKNFAARNTAPAAMWSGLNWRQRELRSLHNLSTAFTNSPHICYRVIYLLSTYLCRQNKANHTLVLPFCHCLCYYKQNHMWAAGGWIKEGRQPMAENLHNDSSTH